MKKRIKSRIRRGFSEFIEDKPIDLYNYFLVFTQLIPDKKHNGNGRVNCNPCTLDIFCVPYKHRFYPQQ